MKHTPVTLTLAELIERTEDSTIADDVAEDRGLGRITHGPSCCDGNEPECPGYRAYTKEELETPIEVSWPEHVQWPEFNGDAYYK